MINIPLKVQVKKIEEGRVHAGRWRAVVIDRSKFEYTFIANKYHDVVIGLTHNGIINDFYEAFVYESDIDDEVFELIFGQKTGQKT